MPTLLRVPLTPQEEDYSCSAACVLSLLRAWGGDAPEAERGLYRDLRISPPVGADASRMVVALKARGLSAYALEDADADSLRRKLRRGIAPIVQLQAWAGDGRDYSADWDSGHYAVLVGEDRRGFYFMDPLSEDRYVSLTRAELEARWHGWEGGRRVRGQVTVARRRGAKLGVRRVARVEAMP